MLKSNLLKRVLVFVVGLFVMAFGVALSVKANLGVSPISCIPYIYSLEYPLTMGETTIIFNVLLILLQMVVKRRKYQLFQLVQFPVVLVFGFFTDFTLFLVSGLQVNNYIGQLALCLLSCVVIGFGVFLEVKAKLTYLAGEGLALAISETFNKEFGKAKIGTDSGMVILGALSSFLLLHQLIGVREGTILAALLVGYLAKTYSRKIFFLDSFLNIESKEVVEEQTLQTVATSRQKKIVVTISREFGSGGHEIGQKVAQKLGLPFYDKELIRLTAEKSGFTPAYIREHEQKLAHSLLYSLYEQSYAYVNEQIPPLDALFMVQSKIIRDITEKESCVIVGRCANFILKDQPGCFNVFIHADNQFREQRILEEYGVAKNEAAKELERTDHERANYCRHYTGKEWSESTNYHLTLDSSSLGIDKAVEVLVNAVKEKDHFVRD